MWKGDEYHYSIGLLEGIAENYDNLYIEGIYFRTGKKAYHIKPNHHIPINIADYKADFDRAFSALSRRQKRVIEAQIKGIPDSQLEIEGFYNIERFRFMAYCHMAGFLNGKGRIEAKLKRLTGVV